MDKVLTKRNIAIASLVAAAAGIGVYFWYKSRDRREKEAAEAEKAATAARAAEEMKTAVWFRDPSVPFLCEVA